MGTHGIAVKLYVVAAVVNVTHTQDTISSAEGEQENNKMVPCIYDVCLSFVQSTWIWCVSFRFIYTWLKSVVCVCVLSSRTCHCRLFIHGC